MISKVFNTIILDLCDKKSEGSIDLKMITEKEINYLLNENKDLREINFKLMEKKEELDRKCKALNLKFENDQSFNIKEKIYNKEEYIKTLKEKVKNLENDLLLSKGKITILESILDTDIGQMDNQKNIQDKDILKHLNDIIIKNVDKRESLRSQNKKLLETLICLGKELKLRKNPNN